MYDEILKFKRFLSATFGEDNALGEYVDNYVEVDWLFFCFWDLTKDDSCFVLRVGKRDHSIIEAMEMIGPPGGSLSLEKVACTGSLSLEGEILFEKQYPLNLCTSYDWLPSNSIMYSGVWCPILRNARGKWWFRDEKKQKQQGSFAMVKLGSIASLGKGNASSVGRGICW